MTSKAELRQTIRKLRTRLAELEATRDELRTENADLKQRLADCEGEPPPPPPADSSKRISMWCSGRILVKEASDAQPEKPPIATADDLAWLKANGVDGFHIITHMPLGGTPSPTHKTVIDATAKWVNEHPEFRCTFGLHTANTGLNWTPFAPWFDDKAWNEQIFPGLDYVAKVVRDSAFVGVTIDGENYHNVRNGWWAANDPTDATEAQVCAKAKERARQIADKLTAYGPIAINQYFLHLTGMHAEYVQHKVNDAPIDNYKGHVDPYWLDGITSQEKVQPYTYLDSVFYKAPHTGTWDEAYQRNLAGWEKHAGGQRPNANLAPFIWITIGPGSRTQINGSGPNPPTAFDYQRPDDQVKVQLEKARQYCQGPEFAIYEQNTIRPPSVQRYPGQWPRGGPYACYAGVAQALKAASS